MSTENTGKSDESGGPVDAASRPEGPPADRMFPVVAIGAAAGGLEAISQLLAGLPEDTGMAFVVVQHLEPSHESHLRERLARTTRMPVAEASHGLEIRPNHVYIIPRDVRMSVAGGVLRVEGRGPHLPIDRVFGSLVEGRQAGAIGAILSGTGPDGALGVEEIKAAGGFTLAQDEASAGSPSMPRNAIRSGCIDPVLPPDARRMVLNVEGPELTLLAIGDVTGLAQAEKPLGRGEERFRLLLDNVTDFAVFFIDPSGHIAGWDEGAARTFGYRTEEIVGRDASLLFIPEDVAEDLPKIELETAARDGHAHDDNWLRRKDGSRLWASGTTTALRDEAGTLRGFVKIIRDRTETHRAQEALAESEQRLRAALSAAQMGTWHWQIPLDRYSLDGSLERMLGLQPSESIHTLDDFLAMIHPQDRAAVAEAFGRSVREGVGLEVEFRIGRPDGAVRWLKDQGEVFRDEQGKPLHMTGACVDVTLRKEYEDELRQARDELDRRVRERTAELESANASLEEQFAARRELLRRQATIEEGERSRISRELHDEMGQYLTALILDLKMLGDEIPAGTPARDRVERLKQITGEVGREVHRIAMELRPTALDDVGLETTLQNYLDEWSSRTGIRVDFHSTRFAPRPSPAVETTLYRVVREALTNVLKHSGAGRVSVILEPREGQASLIVEDNGRGFDVDSLVGDGGSSGRLGLLGMRERVAMVEGTLNVESTPGGPTTLFVRLPLAGAAGGTTHD